MFTADMQLTNKIEPRMPREQVLSFRYGQKTRMD
jgi:hypothetical protein